MNHPVIFDRAEARAVRDAVRWAIQKQIVPESISGSVEELGRDCVAGAQLDLSERELQYLGHVLFVHLFAPVLDKKGLRFLVSPAGTRRIVRAMIHLLAASGPGRLQSAMRPIRRRDTRNHHQRSKNRKGPDRG